MGLTRQLGIGILLGIALCACAGVKFGYKYYELQPDDYRGVLLADKPEHDLPLTVCDPHSEPSPLPSGQPVVPVVMGRCQVMLTAEFLAMRQDFLETKQLLIDCQKGH